MDIKEKLKNLPNKSGVYLMKDSSANIIYIGKATSIRKRVGSHFYKPFSPKISFLISEVSDIDYIITSGEKEALLLENRLIKKFKPKYNVIWKDDKNYPMLKITGEDFPRITIVRRKSKELGKYFGPYPDASSMKRTLKFIRKIFPLRICKMEIKEGDITEIVQKKAKACLYYHINRCSAPCIGKISKNDYAEYVKKVSLLLKGKVSYLLETLNKQMKEASRELKFEKAKEVRDEIRAIESTTEKVRFREISERNIREKEDMKIVLSEVKSRLKLESVPLRIEAIDISNIGDNFSCGVVVVFENGKKSKGEYRRFKIKTVSGQNDFLAIEEVIKRRFTGTLKKMIKPNLIIIDGGKGQLNSAEKILKNIKIDIPVISIEKGEEKIFLSQKTEILILPSNSSVLNLIRNIRDEAHRFALSYHRVLRRTTP